MGVLDKKPHTASVVTGDIPVEVLALSRYDFHHLVDARTQALMREYAERTYMDETVIRQTIHLQNQWDKYRDCLLYTSPSPRDQRGSRMPSSA